MNIVQIGTNVANDDLTKIIGKNEPNKLILVEPFSIHNEKIKECYNWIKNLHIENVAISNLNNKFIDFYYPKINDPNYVLASTSIDHILKHNYKIDDIQKTKVLSTTINNIFDKYNLIDIDILYIDSEGLDFEIIKNINYDKYNIKKIYFEHDHIDRNETHTFLKKLGYNITKDFGENSCTDIAIKPKIKLIHILNTLEGDREKKSIQSLSKLKEYGVDYIQQLTPLYNGDEWEKIKPITNLPHGKGHYGLYQSFTKAIKENFTEDIDALIICECDCILDIPYEDFPNEIRKTLEFCKKHDVYHFSWGGKDFDGISQADVYYKIDDDFPNYCVVNKIIMAHFTILTKQSRNFYLNKVDTLDWETFDVWLNEAIYSEFEEPGKQATTFKSLAYQTNGMSSLENIYIEHKKELESEKNKKVDVLMYCTENYYDTSINLIKTLNILHDYFNIYLYEVNFTKDPNIENVNIINLNDERIGDIKFKNNDNDDDNKNMYKAIFLKSKIILHSLTELKLDEVLYLDSDLLPTTKIDNVLNYFKEIKNYPLIQTSVADYLFFEDFDSNGNPIGIRGNPFKNGKFEETEILEYPLCEKLGIPIKNRIRYANASVLLYNKNCLDFIIEYNSINESAFNLSLNEIKYYYPFVDETTINVLLWKYEYNYRLPLMQVNLFNIDQVKDFYYSNYDQDKEYSIFTIIPSEKNKPSKYFFHGVKKHTSKIISEFIKNFYVNNNSFKIRNDINNNKTLIKCNTSLKTEVKLYKWDILNDNLDFIYGTEVYFNNNEMWFSSITQLKTLTGLKVEILYNNIIIKEEYFKFKTLSNINIPKPILYSQSEVGIGDNLSATPIIKKIHEIYNQKVILLTYIPNAFINNPHIEETIQINKNNYNDILSEYKDNINYKVYQLFSLIGTNWRMIDHKQLCAYNTGFQLKQHELDMEFYPDEYEEIDNLPEKFVCINPSETEPERTWGYKNWQKLINLLQEHIPIVAIGKETYLDPNLIKKFSNIEIKNGLNLLNHPLQNTLSQAYHIISKSETFVTMNNGLYILALCNLDNHITELSTSWDTYFYRTRKGILNYNLDYIRGTCQAECLANPKLNIELIGSTSILKSGTCYLNKSTYECHPTPEKVYESILKKLNI